MAEPSPLTERELRFLRALSEHGVPFLIVGLSAAALQGAPVVTQDIDLWFERIDDPKLATALRQVGGAYVPPTALTPPMFAGEGLELFDIVLRMDGLAGFTTEWATAMDMAMGDVTVRVLPLSRVLVSKRAASHPKDRLVVPVLEDVLALRRHSARVRPHGIPRCCSPWPDGSYDADGRTALRILQPFEPPQTVYLTSCD